MSLHCFSVQAGLIGRSPCVGKASQSRAIDEIRKNGQYLVGTTAARQSVAMLNEHVTRRRVACAGEDTGLTLEFIPSQVVAAWLAKEHVGVLAITDLVEGESRDDLLDPRRVVLPEFQ